MDEEERGRKSFSLYKYRCLHNYLKSSPLIFNVYEKGSNSPCRSSRELTLDDLRDPNKKVAVANLNVEMARIESCMKELEEELEAYKIEKEKEYSKTAQGLVRAGGSCNDEGKYKDAIEAFEQAIRLDANSADAFRGLGMTYSNTGEYEKTKAAFEKAIEIEPDYRDAYCYLALIFSELGEHEKAIETCEQAIKIKPAPGSPTAGYAFTYFSLGVIYCNYGWYGDAIGAFKEATKLRSYYTEAYVCLGIASELEYRRYKNSIDGQMSNLKPNYFHPYPTLNGILRRLRSRKDEIDGLNGKKGET